MAQSNIRLALATVGLLAFIVAPADAHEMTAPDLSLRAPAIAPLLDAAGRGEPHRVSDELAARATVDAADSDGNTALLLAAARGHVSIARLLVDAGANVNHQNRRGESAAMLAAANGHTAIVRILSAKRADFALRKPDGSTALDHASAHCQDGVIGELTSTPEPGHRDAAFLAAAARCGEATLMAIVTGAKDAKALVNARDAKGRTALWHAAEHANIQALSYLVRSGASLDAADEALETPLHRAAGNLDTTGLLLAAGANPNASTREGTTPLMRAAMLGSGAANVIVAKGAALNARNKFGQTPLILAAAAGHTGVVDLLVAAGADRSIRNARRETARDVALMHGHKGLAASLK